MDKIGIGFITCNREDYLQQSMKSFKGDIHEGSSVVIINDGKPLKEPLPYGKLVNNKNNIGVGKSKNKAFKYLLDQGCEYIFIIEDDIIKKDSPINVFDQYIKYSKKTGIQHFMFGYHGPANKGNISYGAPLCRATIKYSDDISVLLNLHCVGAFCFYTKKCLDTVGLFDESYNNAFEHVDHSYMIAKAGMIPGYWWWPDIDNSYNILGEIKCSEESSSIRFRKDWKDNIMAGFRTFTEKHKYSPAWENIVPDQSETQIKINLRNIHSTYAVD